MGKNFVELEIWQEGKQLAVDILKIWEQIGSSAYFALRDQMQRSSVSIASNIAEGSERKTKTEYIRYLYIAKSSAAELRTQLFILKELKISKGVDVESFIERTEVLSKRIQRLISVLYT